MAKTKFLDYNGLSKLVEKIKNTYVNIAGSTMTGTLKISENQPAINFRPNNNSYSVTLNYDTENAEALAINLKNSATSFMINSGVDGTTWIREGYQSKVIPTIQVRKNCVAINKYIADNISPEYRLEVNGSVKADSFVGKLGSNDVGSKTKPMYLNGGTPTTCTYELNKTVPSTAVFTDKNVYQVFDNATTSFLPLLLSPLTEDTKADEVHQTTNAKYNFAIGAVPSEGKIKATIFDGTTFTGNAATASRATYADKYSYNGVDRDFVYDVVDGENHYIRCKDATIIRANGINLNKYEFIINSDGKGGCYIYDGANAKGTTWSPDGIVFEKAPVNSLVAANGTFIMAITDAEIQTEIDKAITL